MFTLARTAMGLAVLGLASAVTAQEAPVAPAAPTAPTPSFAAGGSGPPAPSLTTTREPGTWKPAPTAGGSSLTSMGRTAYIDSANSFCLFMPPDPTKENLVEAEADAVAYCVNPTNGTRPMPDGLVLSAHYIQTQHYKQVIGTLNPAVMNLGFNDCGGEYDNHGAEGVGNPVGASIKGGSDFFQFMGGCDFNYQGPGQGSFIFCIRSCFGDRAYPDFCNNQFDLMGCQFVAPSPRYEEAGFDNCDADAQFPVGVFSDGSTFRQGQSSTPVGTYPPVPSSSNCQSVSSIQPSGVTYSFNQAIITGTPAAGASSSNGSGAAAGTTSSRSAGTAGATSSGGANAAASSLKVGGGAVAAALTLFAGLAGGVVLAVL